MGRQRKLGKAPITEAVIDLRLADGVSITAGDQDRLHEAVGKDSFPVVTVQQEFVAKFQPFEQVVGEAMRLWSVDCDELAPVGSVTENRSVFITQGMQPTDGGFAIRLDMDAFEAGAFRCEENEVLPILEELRGLKNSTFFNTLTDKVIGRYE